MRSRRRAAALLALWALLGAAAPAAPALPQAAGPVRLGGRAFGFAAEIEVRDLGGPAADRAIRDAFAELENARRESVTLVEAARGGLPVPLTLAQLDLLDRAQAICAWSDGTLGPAGGELFRVWGLGEPADGLPTPDELERAVAASGCDRLAIEAAAARVAAGTSLELAPFALGWAVDRAAGRLREHGSADHWIAVGPLARAAGPGPEGRGWPVEPPRFAGQEERLGGFLLRDRALAVLTPELRPLRVAGERYSSFVDFRRGRPAAGIVAVMVVSELALDAAAVGYVMFARGAREGTMLLGALPEKPSIRWLLGTGGGPPVLTDVHWGAVPRR
jgi:thiamine biosynthesis lipoprotein